MYCTNCGSEINDNDACRKCGFDPTSEKNFCSNCGTKTDPRQVICTHCGVSLGGNSVSVTIGEDKTIAILSYITLIGFIIALVMHSSNKTKLGAYHLRQALGLMCTGFAIYIVLMILVIIPFLFIIKLILMPLVSLGILVLLIMGIINAANGEMKPVPLVGQLYEKWFASVFN